MSNVEFVPGWEAMLDEPVHALLDEIGSEVAADASRYAPRQTGRLARSIDHEVTGDTVRVTAHAPYAAYVEEGHRIVAWGHQTNKIEPPQPYLRPALYKPRGGAL